MIMNVDYCPNCKSIMTINLIEIERKPIYLGVYSCPTCHIINLSKDFAKELVSKILKQLESEAKNGTDK